MWWAQSCPVGPRAARWRPKMASKWVKIGLKRAFFRGTAKIPPKYAKKCLFCLKGAFVLKKKKKKKRRRAHCAGHLWRQHVAVHHFSRCFNTSKSGVQRKSNGYKLPRRVGPAGLAPQGWPRRVGPAGQQLFSHSPRSAHKNLVNYQF